MLALSPLRIYNRRPVIVKATSHRKDGEIEKLKAEVKKHKVAERKIKMHAQWLLRSTQAAHNDAKDIAQIIKDLYSDDAFE